MPAAPELIRDELRTVQRDWEGLRKSTDVILASEQTVLSLHQVAATLAETIPQLQAEYDKVVENLLQSRAPAAQVVVAQRQALLAERILGSVNTVLAGDETAVQAADAFGRDAASLAGCLTACWKAMRRCASPRSKIAMPGAAGGNRRAVRVRVRLGGRNSRNLARAVSGA
ncbi:hypothetical protein F2S73_24615 [Pseudomonas syringae pv. actinidiae]|nr:hypothetical protein [Pseudomonas syringae pv. actinidiae]